MALAFVIARQYEENKKIKDARKGGIEAFSNLYKEVKDFDELDDEYYKLNEQTMKNIENYIRKNPNEFCIDEWPFWMFEENIKIVNELTDEEEQQRKSDESQQNKSANMGNFNPGSIMNNFNSSLGNLPNIG